MSEVNYERARVPSERIIIGWSLRGGEICRARANIPASPVRQSKQSCLLVWLVELLIDWLAMLLHVATCKSLAHSRSHSLLTSLRPRSRRVAFWSCWPACSGAAPVWQVDQCVCPAVCVFTFGGEISARNREPPPPPPSRHAHFLLSLAVACRLQSRTHTDTRRHQFSPACLCVVCKREISFSCFAFANLSHL